MTTDERPYHHGDLRRALLDAAWQLVAEKGVAGLTLREVARQAGVSHNAPYHHFADKAALVAALVEQGFAEFAAAMENAYESAPGSPLEKLTATGVAYVRFAMTHRAQFRLMFRPELRASDPPDDPCPSDSYKKSDGYEVLIRGLTAAQSAGLIVAGDIAPLAVTAWSTVHGLTDLILDGNRDLATTTDDALALARVVMETLIHGLARRA